MLIIPSMVLLRDAMWAHALTGFYHGYQDEIEQPYFKGANRWHTETHSRLIFTRDEGMHTSGWLKNPDYDRCWHLSISFWDFMKQQNLPFERRSGEAWARCFFGENARLLWIESASEESKVELSHYRLMCDVHWQPILPRKEVYSRDFTPADWKSFSDLHGDENWEWWKS